MLRGDAAFALPDVYEWSSRYERSWRVGRVGSGDEVSQVPDRVLSASAAVGYVAVGAAAMLSRSIAGAVREVLAWISPYTESLHREAERILSAQP